MFFVGELAIKCFKVNIGFVGRRGGFSVGIEALAVTSGLWWGFLIADLKFWPGVRADFFTAVIAGLAYTSVFSTLIFLDTGSAAFSSVVAGLTAESVSLESLLAGLLRTGS